MQRTGSRKILFPLGILLLFSCFIGYPLTSHAGFLKIIMHDGKSLEVPFCWEEDGQVKFEMAGGIAGIPKGNISSIQEVISGGEFDPEVMIKGANASQESQKTEILQDLVDKQKSAKPAYRELTPEEIDKILRAQAEQGQSTEARNVQIHATKFYQQGNFSELVRMEGNGVLMVMKYILTTHDELSNKRFTLNLYDGQGRIIQRRTCEIYQLAADKNTLREIGASGTLFSVVATVKPDPKIKRYEIIATRD